MKLIMPFPDLIHSKRNTCDPTELHYVAMRCLPTEVVFVHTTIQSKLCRFITKLCLHNNFMKPNHTKIFVPFMKKILNYQSLQIKPFLFSFFLTTQISIS